MSLRKAIAGAVLILALPGLGCRGVSAGESVDWKLERGRQMDTMNNMHMIDGLITLHRQDHHKDPAHLDELVRAYDSDQAITKDGWGRDLYYYSTGDTFVLASFGKNGIPMPSRCEPGCFADAAPPETLYDIDIVMINGAWAQTPKGVER